MNTKNSSPLNLDPKTTALVLIDLQKGITTIPAEPLDAKTIIKNAKELKDAFREKDGVVVLVRVTGSADGKDMLRPNADEPMTRSGEMPKDWAEIVPELDFGGTDILITKRQWGAFYGTELDMQLRRRGIKTIVLGGISTNYGVESTARDAYERGYDLVFASDAMGSRQAADHEFAITKIFPRIGKIREVQEIIAAL
jgi:nicotinamidase-related amidase